MTCTVLKAMLKNPQGHALLLVYDDRHQTRFWIYDHSSPDLTAFFEEIMWHNSAKDISTNSIGIVTMSATLILVNAIILLVGGARWCGS